MSNANVVNRILIACLGASRVSNIALKNLYNYLYQSVMYREIKSESVIRSDEGVSEYLTILKIKEQRFPNFEAGYTCNYIEDYKVANVTLMKDVEGVNTTFVLSKNLTTEKYVLAMLRYM